MAWILGCSLPPKSGTFWLEYLTIDVRIEQVGVFQVLEVFLSNVWKTGTFSGMHCFQKSHVFISLRIASPERNLGDRRQEVKGRIPRASYISSFQNIPKGGLRLPRGKCSVYSRACTVEKKVDPGYSASHSHWLAGPSQRTRSLFSFPKDLKKPGFTLLQNETWTCTHFSEEEEIFSWPPIGSRILLDTQVWKLSPKKVSQTKEARGLSFGSWLSFAKWERLFRGSESKSKPNLVTPEHPFSSNSRLAWED